MLVDSHCHLNFIDLKDFEHQLQNVIDAAKVVGVGHMLSVCVELEDYPELQNIADSYENISISVGVHPNTIMAEEVKASELITLANQHPSCIAIGETGLDYYRTEGIQQQDLQRERFRQHIHAALETKKPLIIHTRQAAEDTLAIMAEEKAEETGGVMHCFAEDLDVAKRAIEMNFYISFSGILTFKNAKQLQEVAKTIPLDRILIETDAPYLAPVPFRGKQNHPALVKHVAEFLGELRQIDYEEITKITARNFFSCFKLNGYE